MSDGKTPLNTDNKNKTGQQITGGSKIKDWTSAANEFWQEFKAVKYGIVGLILLIMFFLLIIFEPYIVAFPEAGDNWKDITYWEDNPRNAAPIWVNWISSRKGAIHEFLRNPEWEVQEKSQFNIVKGTFTYDYQYDLPPDELTLKALGKGNMTIQIDMERPDGQEIKILKKNIKTSKETEIQIPLSSRLGDRAYSFAKRVDTKENLERIDRDMVSPFDILFAKAQEGILQNPDPLTGKYKIHINAVVMGDKSFIEDPYLIVSGRVFGFLGTDDSKRDVWSGIVAGVKWALLIGLLTAFASVTVGVIFGVTSAYFGGWVDSFMMRIFEIFVSIPMLPVLIVLSALYKPSIWNMIIIMCILYWTGPVRTVRSMGLQIKEETYVEAARALDASHGRIIFKHMIPQLIPYAFASMALRVPSAIVAEASVSLLGLGDASIVTWGQILHDAMNNGAMLQGLWWWIVPPGLIIALMGMTFAFIGFSMDKILNPKLKTR